MPPRRGKHVEKVREALTFLNLFHFDAHFPIVNRICEMLPIADVINLTRTCKQLCGLYKALVPAQWSINRKLQRFVRDPQGFRTQMSKCDALISGSFAVQYFERVTWKDSDLDVFVRYGLGTDSFHLYVCAVEGYQYVKTTKNQDYADMPNVLCEVRTYTKSSTNEPDPLKLQIVVTWEMPVRAILTGFYSTTVVNCISWNKAYALFPLSTFVHHQGYMLTSYTDQHPRLLAKYSLRGFETKGVKWPEDERSNHPIRNLRRISDRFSWIIECGTEHVERSKIPDHVLSSTEFSMRADKAHDFDSRIIGHYGVTATVFKSHVLRYEYLTASWITPDRADSWIAYFGERVNSSNLMELYKLDPLSRPADYHQLIEYPGSLWRNQMQFEKPKSWKYCDEDVPKWVREWEQIGVKNAVK